MTTKNIDAPLNADYPSAPCSAIPLVLAATYREKSTGRLMTLIEADTRESSVTLWPAEEWKGSIEDLNNQFDFYAPHSSKQNAEAMASTDKKTPPKEPTL